MRTDVSKEALKSTLVDIRLCLVSDRDGFALLRPWLAPPFHALRHDDFVLQAAAAPQSAKVLG